MTVSATIWFSRPPGPGSDHASRALAFAEFSLSGGWYTHYSTMLRRTAWSARDGPRAKCDVSRLHLIFSRVFEDGIKQGIGAFICMRDGCAPKEPVVNERLYVIEGTRHPG